MAAKIINNEMKVTSRYKIYTNCIPTDYLWFAFDPTVSTLSFSFQKSPAFSICSLTIQLLSSLLV